MAKYIQGQLVASGLRFAIAAARFNNFITEPLLNGAIDALQRHGCNPDDVTVAWVPGSFELPFICQKLAETKKFDAVIALGAVIRGATSHYDLVCGEAAGGIGAVSRATGIPVIFGVITTDTIEQAIERAGTKAGNKGVDAAVAAIEMATLAKLIKKGDV